MPLPRTVAQLNRVGLNRLTRHIAPWAPGFGLVIHRGRKSGTIFRTPVNVFLRNGSYVVALTYGPNADWVRNVLAAGGCELVTQRATVRLTAPRIEHSDSRKDLPIVVRTILQTTNVHEYLILDRAG